MISRFGEELVDVWHVKVKIDTGIGEEDQAEAAEVEVRGS